MLPSSAPPWGPGPPDPAPYSTIAAHNCTAECVDGSTSGSATHNRSTSPRGQPAGGDTASPTPASVEVLGRKTQHRRCSTSPPLKPLMKEAFLARAPEKPRCTLASAAMESTGDPPHPSKDSDAETSACIRATCTGSRTRVDHAPPLSLSATVSSVQQHLGMIPQVASSNSASYQASASAPSTPSNRKEASKMRRRSSSAFMSRLPSDTRLRTSLLAAFGVHVETHGRCDAPSHAPLPVRGSLSMTNSTDVTPVASDTHFRRSVNEGCSTVESHCTATAAASCVVVRAPSGAFRALPHPSIWLNTSLAGIGGVPSFNSSTPSTNASVLKDRHSSGAGTCEVPSESSLLPPFRTSSSFTAGTLTPSPETGVAACQVGEASTPLSVVKSAVSHPMQAAPQQPTIPARKATAAPAAALNSKGRGDVSPAPALEVPMTPQSFSTMLLARESSEGAQHPVRAGSATSATTTNGARSSSLAVQEGNDTMLRQSSQQVPIVSQLAEDAWSGGGVAANGIEDWCVDGGSRDSREARTTSTTHTSGVGSHPCLVPGSGSGSSNSRVDLETGVIETDTLERARAVSKDGSRAYEIVNGKYVMYDYELGRGSYATVRLCYNMADGHFYAVKVLDRVRLKRRQLGSEAGLCKIDQEIAMMKQVQHKNIIALHEVIRDPSMRYVYLVLELAESREVLSMRDNGDVLPRGDDDGAATAYPEAAAREMVKGLLQALMYIHYLGVAHRDIKPSNVLRTADGTVKLCDFGVSVLVGDAPMQLSREGSVAFLAPELLLSSEVEVSRFLTPDDSSLGSTRNKSATHMLADSALATATRNARTTVTSTTTATSATELASTGGPASPKEEGAKWTQRLMSSFAGAALQPNARAAASRAPGREIASPGGGAPSAIPPWPSSASLPKRGGGGGAARRASFRTLSLSPCGAAARECAAAIATAAASPCAGGAAAVTPPTGAYSPSTPAAQPFSDLSKSAGNAPVDLLKADVFALGVTVYTLLLGHLPWRASSAVSQRAAILAEPDPFLRLYKAAYGDAYVGPPQVREACMPRCDVLGSDAIPASSHASTSASGKDGRGASYGTANAELSDGQWAIAAEKDDVVTPAPVTALPCKWRHLSNTGTTPDECTSEQEKCTPTAAKLTAAPQPHRNAPTRSDRNSAQPVGERSTAAAALPRPATQLLAKKATTSESRAPKDLAESPSDDHNPRAPFEAPPPPMPPQQERHLHRFQWRPFMDVVLGSAPIKTATAAGTAITQQAQVTVRHRRGGGGELVDGDLQQTNATTTCIRSRAPAVKMLLSRAATQPRFGSVVQVPHSLAICGDERATWEAQGAAMSGPAVAPPLRPRGPTTTPDQLYPYRGILDVDDDDWMKADESDVVQGMKESAINAEQWVPGSSSDLLRTVPSSAVTGTRSNDSEADSASDCDSSTTTVPCSAAKSTASSLPSDDDEDLESCESIYERLFEMEQPCRAYTVVEHMPLPTMSGTSREISGEAVDFVRSCLCLDPAERRTVFELFRHPWIRGGEGAMLAEAGTSAGLGYLGTRRPHGTVIRSVDLERRTLDGVLSPTTTLVVACAASSLQSTVAFPVVITTPRGTDVVELSPDLSAL
ncbi:Protein kinase domain family protein [Leishmania donovani]|uniref:Protein kinase domain family protein n=1 Tax=Leishmania donovani TaxID=5661 RepID=A0A504XUM8_LEIDO|nr:Protein kinase domain family protein [Leishmania donovani]